MTAAREALPTPGATVARAVLAADLALLGDVDDQIAAAEDRIATLLPGTDYQVLTTTPGWGSVRAAGYAAALGPLHRWGGAAQIYRAAGLTPIVYASAGKRRDGGIIGCALARRANKIAYAMVRDQGPFTPTRWS